MKKVLYCAAAFALACLAGSCQQENPAPGVDGGLTYTISLPEAPQTKGSSGYDEYDLYYEVYQTVDDTKLADLDLEPLFEGNVVMSGDKHSITFHLLNDQDYTLLFWANKKGEKYFKTEDLRNVEVVQAASNNSDRDAFCGMDQLDDFDGATNKTVKLIRPFAQLNIATLVPTIEEAGYDLSPGSSSVTVEKIPVAYNVFTKEQVGADKKVDYTVNAVPAETLEANGKVYNLVAMNYVLVPEGNITVTYSIDTPNGTVYNTIENVPVRANYRTNIVGNLLTSNATYAVEIIPGFADGEGNIEVLNNGIVKNINGDYEITTAAGFAYAINNLFVEGGNFYVLNDIDLTGVSYNPADVPAGVNVYILGELPEVQLKSTVTGIRITGLECGALINTNNGIASFSGITIENSKDNSKAAFIEINKGTVEISGCATQAQNFIGTNEGAVTAFDNEVPADKEVVAEGNTPSDRIEVATADALVEALEAGNAVLFVDNIKIDPANMSNAYGATGINVKKGQAIYGNGKTLDIKGAGGTWDSGISTTGGLIKDLTVTGSFRGIFVNHNSDYSDVVRLENVTIDGTVYTISCDQGTNQNLEAVNSTFKGWTSYAATIGTVKFTDCYFGEGSGYAFCRPYAPTAFIGCEFEAGFEMDPRAAVTFENCTLDGVALTADNLATLVTSNIANATVK